MRELNSFCSKKYPEYWHSDTIALFDAYLDDIGQSAKRQQLLHGMLKITGIVKKDFTEIGTDDFFKIYVENRRNGMYFKLEPFGGFGVYVERSGVLSEYENPFVDENFYARKYFTGQTWTLFEEYLDSFSADGVRENVTNTFNFWVAVVFKKDFLEITEDDIRGHKLFAENYHARQQMSGFSSYIINNNLVPGYDVNPFNRRKCKLIANRRFTLNMWCSDGTVDLLSDYISEYISDVASDPAVSENKRVTNLATGFNKTTAYLKKDFLEFSKGDARRYAEHLLSQGLAVKTVWNNIRYCERFGDYLQDRIEGYENPFRGLCEEVLGGDKAVSAETKSRAKLNEFCGEMTASMLAEYAPTLKGGTVSNVIGAIDRVTRYCKKDFCALTDEDMQKYKTWRLSCGRSEGTASVEISYLSAFARYITESPARSDHAPHLTIGHRVRQKRVRGDYYKSCGEPFVSVFEEYLHSLTSSTYRKSVVYEFNRFLSYSNKDFFSMTLADIQGYLSYLKSFGLSESSLQQYGWIISAFSSFAASSSLVDGYESPFSKNKAGARTSRQTKSQASMRFSIPGSTRRKRLVWAKEWFVQTINKERQKKRYSFKHVSDSTGMDIHTILTYHSMGLNRRTPSVDTVVRLCAFYDIPFDDDVVSMWTDVPDEDSPRHERLRYERVRRGYDIHDVAEMLDVSCFSLRKAERARGNAAPSLVDKLYDFYGLSREQGLTEEGGGHENKV